MHAKNFVHKDLKPDNILITNNENTIIGDLGVSGPVHYMDHMAPKKWAAP